MMRKFMTLNLMFLVTIIFIWAPFFCYGDSSGSMPEENSQNFWSGVWDDFKYPITSRSTNKYMIGGLVGTGILLATRNDTVDPFQESMSTRKPLGDQADFFRVQGEWVPNVIYMLGTYVAGWSLKEDSYFEFTKVMLRATIYSGALTTVLKYTVREPRPNDPNDTKSYPSGHTTTAFAFASVVGANHGWKWGVPAYLLATGAGLSRINDNKHYLHDVVMGATIGTAYGIGMSSRYVKFKEKQKLTSYSAIPLFSKGFTGVSLYGEF